MKKLLLFSFILLNFVANSQEFDEIFIREQINLGDSGVTKIYGDTLVNPVFVRNLINITPTDAAGNNTEIQINSSGILGSSPRFTYNPLDSTLVVDSLQLANGEKISWNTEKHTINIPTGLGSTIQAGQELQIQVYNNSGSFIANGTAVNPIGNFNGTHTIGLAQSNSFENIGVDYGLTTTDVDDNSFGFVVWFGEARDLNTSMFSLGDTIWISPTVAGELVNVMPEFPDYFIQLGIVQKVGTTDGIIFVTSRSNVDDTFKSFYNGTFRETFDFLVTATGGVITGTLSPANGHVDMTMLFNDGFSLFDTSPSSTVTLTAGTNANPEMNYVYIPQSTKVLTVNTSGFPSTQHVKVAKLLLKSASFVERYKATINQNINDGLADATTLQGRLSVITNRIRLDHAKHRTGTEGVSTIVIAPTPDDVWVSVTQGIVAQLNDHVYPAFDSQTGDSLYISNHFTNPDTLVGNLNEQINDALGNSLNNTSFSFVAWGVVNKTGEPSLVKINLPTNSYAFASPQNAVSDALNYSVTTFPPEYTGVGFLIARFTYTYKNDDWVLIDTQDLTGFTPNTAPSGGAGGAGVTSYLGLTDTESSYTAYEFQVANAGATALESPSGLTYNGDSLTLDGDLAADTITADEAIGIGTRHPLSALHLNKGTGSLSTGLTFLDGTFGLYPSISNEIAYAFSGSIKWSFNETEFKGRGGPRLSFINQASTNTKAVFRVDGAYNSGLGGSSGDVSIVSNGKEIARASENVTEQFIINPQGDLTGTAAAPSLALGDGDSGWREEADDLFSFSLGGGARWQYVGNSMRGVSTGGAHIKSNAGTMLLPSITFLNYENTGLSVINPNEMSVSANGIEAMRLTEDTVFVDSTIAPLQIKFPDGTIQTTAPTGGGISFGSQYQIPFTNATTDDFDYNSSITYNSSTDEMTIDGTVVNPIGTIANLDATPDVSGGNNWSYNGSSGGASDITNLDNAVIGATYTLINVNSTNYITVTDGGNFNLEGSWLSGAIYGTLTVICVASNTFTEIGRNQ